MAPSTVEWLICLALVSLASCASFAPTSLCCRLGLRRQLAVKRQYIMFAGCWFGTFCIFHNMWDNPSHWPIFFRGVETTNQFVFDGAPTMLRSLQFSGPMFCTKLNKLGRSLAGSACPSQVHFRSAEKGEKASGIQWWWVLTGVMHLNTSLNMYDKVKPGLIASRLVGSQYNSKFGSVWVC